MYVTDLSWFGSFRFWQELGRVWLVNCGSYAVSHCQLRSVTRRALGIGGRDKARRETIQIFFSILARNSISLDHHQSEHGARGGSQCVGLCVEAGLTLCVCYIYIYIYYVCVLYIHHISCIYLYVCVLAKQVHGVVLGGAAAGRALSRDHRPLAARRRRQLMEKCVCV